MRNAIIITLVGVFIVSLITIGVAYAVPQTVPQEMVASSMPAPPTVEDTSGYPYLLRSYEGKLAMFTEDLVQPDMVFDVYVRTLPEADQQQLERGIRLKSYDELTARIEDYIS